MEGKKNSTCVLSQTRTTGHNATKTPKHPAAHKAVALFGAAVLTLGLLAGCAGQTQESSSSAVVEEAQGHTVTFDAGNAQSQFGIQNADNMPYEKEYQPGDTVDIPNISGEDYNVFIPGYTLTGWQRSDTNEIIPVQTDDSDNSGGSEDGTEEDVYSVIAETANTIVEETGAAIEDNNSSESSASNTSNAASDNSSSSNTSTNSDNGDSSNSSTDSVAEFIMPDNNVTLTAQWTPITIDVYAAQGEGAEPTYVATVDLSGAGIQGSAEDTSVWQSYNTFNQGEARVFTSAFYFPLEAVFDQAGIDVAADDKVILGENFVDGTAQDTDSVEHDWDFYTTGMFYPDTTCDTYSLNGAQAVTPSLSLSYKESRSTSKSEALSKIVERNITEGLNSQSAEMCPRALFGVPTSSYDKNENYSGYQHPYNVNQILIIK